MLLRAFVLLAALPAVGGKLPSGWRQEQAFSVPSTGLVKLSLPPDTLDAARPALEDLRLYDDAGNEIPYLIEFPAPVARISRASKSFQVALEPDSTVMTLETGFDHPLDAVTLESPAADFIKSVRVEGSDDGARWQVLAQNRLIFQQPSGASHLEVSFAAVTERRLRLIVDDRRSRPVPFTGASLHGDSGGPPPGEWIQARITERDEIPGETRLALNLGAANLSIAAVRIETSEPLFMRQVSIAFPEFSEDLVRERVIGRGAVFRVAVPGQAASENLTLPLEQLVRSRELFLLVRNGDSPPLAVSSVSLERRPVCLVFLARETGVHHLITGNPQCPPPRYDLAGLRMELKSLAALPVKIPPPADNPDFRPAEVLPGVELAGPAPDVAAWAFRKPVKIASGGAQQTELDLEVLARAREGFPDLRLLSHGRQKPYIIQRTSISRALNLSAVEARDPKNPKLSRFLLQLPKPGLPLTKLVCSSTTPVFARDVWLVEELTDERGNPYRNLLGRADWTRTPERASGEFTLTLDRPPRSDTLLLETENGDNPPVALEKFSVYYSATRILFKAKPDDELFLYYGNPDVRAPSYDLNLVAGQMLAAEKKTSSLLAEEPLRRKTWAEGRIPGRAGIVFWGVLALVVAALFLVIARLLPKSQPPAA